MENIDWLNKMQSRNEFHPLTCNGHEISECKRTKSYNDRFNGIEVEYTPENEGVLIATEKHWICPCGKYIQEYNV